MTKRSWWTIVFDGLFYILLGYLLAELYFRYA